MAGFRNRTDAGRQLARELSHWRAANPVVLALPRGGVPVGYEVACALRAPLDVVGVHKLGVPGQPELAFGAVGEDGVTVFNDDVVDSLSLTVERIDAVAAHEAEGLDEALRDLRGTAPRIDPQGRTAILVDDGIATGATVRAAVAVLHARAASAVVLAVPVGPPDTLAALRPQVTDLVCIRQPAGFLAVGQWYADFGQVGTAAVRDLMERAAARSLAD